MTTAKKRVARLVRLVRRRNPGANVIVDAPSQAAGDWFIDVRLGKRAFVVELRPAVGFGLSSVPAEGIGEGPDEYFEDERGVVERIAEVVRGRARTAPQRVRLLQELRMRMHVSQVAVAAKLAVRQPTISKIERREDVNVSTLRRYVRALGGELQITARFPGGDVEIGGAAKPARRSRT